MDPNEKTSRPSLDRQSEKSTTVQERCVRLLEKSVDLQRQQIMLLAHLTGGPFKCPEQLELFGKEVSKAESALQSCEPESNVEAESEALFVHANYLGASSFPTVHFRHVVHVEGESVFVIKAEFRDWYGDLPWVCRSPEAALAFFVKGGGILCDV